MTTRHGSCHCGGIRFEVDTDLSEPMRCNPPQARPEAPLHARHELARVLSQIEFGAPLRGNHHLEHMRVSGPLPAIEAGVEVDVLPLVVEA